MRTSLNVQARMIVILVLGLALVLAACGGGGAAEPTAVPDMPAEAPAPSPESDSSPSQTGSTAETRTFQIVPSESEASYTVEEEFFSGAVTRFGKELGFFTTVGTTNEIEGQVTFQLDGEALELESGEFVVDISTLESDDARRDRVIRERFLQSQVYPEARFVVTGVEGFPENYQPGQEASFRLLGDLTIREVTQPATFDVTATLDGDALAGTATTRILMTDFDFNPPGFAGMMQAENEALITVNFTARAS